jgi:hypothetical protein
MRGWAVWLAGLAIASGCASHAPQTGAEVEAAPILILDDAERFAALLEGGFLPDADVLQADYIDKGTRGIEIFTPYRIEDGVNLAANLAAEPERYRRAIEVCLPAAREMQAQTSATLEGVSELLDVATLVPDGAYPNPVPAYIVFGAGNSGGTAAPDGLVMGLEVLCDGRDAAEIRQVLEEFVAHEVTHSYQGQVRDGSEGQGLLSIVLTEGFADFVMELSLGRPSLTDAERAAYGLAHEPQLWAELKADIDAGVMDNADWLYGQGRGGRVNDLGYWIGKRICEAYYAQADDKTAALQTLLKLDDPAAILAASGYAGRFAPD